MGIAGTVLRIMAQRHEINENQNRDLAAGKQTRHAVPCEKLTIRPN
jgi:hypothetical protein